MMNIADWSAEQIELRYDDSYENHHKFYRISVLKNEVEQDYRVVYEWGRIGTNGQSQSKPCYSLTQARSLAHRRCSLKENKGYTSANGWQMIEKGDVDSSLLTKGGVNVYITPKTAEQEEGVTFAQMQEQVASVLQMAVGEGTPDPVDAAYNAAVMNAKLTELRRQMELLEAEAEFANTAVRSRM